jgi:arginase
VQHLTSAADRWWLHVDLDVLDPVEFPAQGLPDVADDPGGLTGAQLATLLSTAAAAGGCAGLSLAIYDPDQDPDRSGARTVVELIRTIAPALD